MLNSVKDNYPEINDIESDINNLKTDAVEFAKHVKQDGEEHAHELKAILKSKLKLAKAKAQNELKVLEAKVQKKPGQTLAMAFAGGVIASILLGRR